MLEIILSLGFSLLSLKASTNIPSLLNTFSYSTALEELNEDKMKDHSNYVRCTYKLVTYIAF